MDRDIKTTIDRLNQRIAKLTNARDILIEEYGGLANGADMPLFQTERAGLQLTGHPTTAQVNPTRKRKQAIVDFLASNGPAKRKDIVAKTGIPAGTVSYELNDKDAFERQNDGRYAVRS